MQRTTANMKWYFKMTKYKERYSRPKSKKSKKIYNILLCDSICF